MSLSTLLRLWSARFELVINSTTVPINHQHNVSIYHESCLHNCKQFVRERDIFCCVRHGDLHRCGPPPICQFLVQNMVIAEHVTCLLTNTSYNISTDGSHNNNNNVDNSSSSSASSSSSSSSSSSTNEKRKREQETDKDEEKQTKHYREEENIQKEKEPIKYEITKYKDHNVPSIERLAYILEHERDKDQEKIYLQLNPITIEQLDSMGSKLMEVLYSMFDRENKPFPECFNSLDNLISSSGKILQLLIPILQIQGWTKWFTIHYLALVLFFCAKTPSKHSRILIPHVIPLRSLSIKRIQVASLLNINKLIFTLCQLIVEAIFIDVKQEETDISAATATITTSTTTPTISEITRPSSPILYVKPHFKRMRLKVDIDIDNEDE